MHLTLGSEGEEVRKLQEELAEADRDVGPADGVFGPRTKRAVVDFQRERDLTVDGVVGPETAGELDLDFDADFPKVPEERAAFRRLVAANPNYFGNLPELPYEAVEEKEGDTSYEELTCLGYDPDVERLEAVVSIKRTYGYKGDVCTDGSTEYVRFFIDRDNDGTWEDLGVASTTVYDLPGPKPVDYAIALDLDEEQTRCSTANLPRIRAILSWEFEPPAGDPDYPPVWGNRTEASIQIAPRGWHIIDVLEELDIGEPDLDLPVEIDFDAPIAYEPASLDAATLLKRYDDTSVPAHRAGFGEFKRLLDGSFSGIGGPIGPGGPGGPGGPDDFPEPFPPEPFPPEPFPPDDEFPQFPIEIPPELELDIDDLIEGLFETSGNTSYEELGCVGLQQDVLTGVFQVKQSSGYSGGLCSDGSQEYVAFWEWNDAAAGWDHLGTASVSVYDIPGAPGDGLWYAVHLPVDLSHHRKPCGAGPSVVRIRATLSWNQKPPASDPNFVPTWGNRVETRVHVAPGPRPLEEGRLAVGTVGSVPTAFVEQTAGLATTGTATGPSVSNGFSATDAPFGGLVTITGRPQDGLDPASSGAGALKYRVSVRPYRPGVSDEANPWQPLTDELTVFSYTDPTVEHTVTVDADGFYTHVPQTINDVLAKWRTDGDGVYELRVEAKRGDGTPVHTDVISYADGSTESRMLVKLDNTRPDAAIDITGVLPDGSGPQEPATECDFFQVGDTVVGTFHAEDEHLRRYSLFVRPTGPAGDAVVRETSSPTVLHSSADTGDWELKTAWSADEDVPRPAGEMASCGYTVHVHVVDNTIVGNHYGGHRRGDSEGFCLLAPGQEVVDGDGGDGE
jgi:hypothetical protein